MSRKIFFLLTIFYLSSPSLYSQLKKLSSPNLHSVVDVFTDDNGNWYSTSITIKFAKKTIELPRGLKKAALADILIPTTKRTLEKVEKNMVNSL